MNNEKFVYVFDTDTRDAMLKDGYMLISGDERNSVYIFLRENKNATFSFDGVTHIFSNTIYF